MYLNAVVADFCHLVISLFRGRNNEDYGLFAREITIIIIFSPTKYLGGEKTIMIVFYSGEKRPEDNYRLFASEITKIVIFSSFRYFVGEKTIIVVISRAKKTK